MEGEVLRSLGSRMFWEQRAEGGRGEEGACPELPITGFSQAYPGSMETYMVYFPMPGTPEENGAIRAGK